MPRRPLLKTLPMLLTLSLAAFAQAQNVPPIPFEMQTLPNGLKVIYAPMSNAPVVHVRVLYHVGSRDEKADRQGFAHMFEHMMFRGSAHVKAEEHMNRIQDVGGISNAFTSFDQTTYVNTVPNNHLEMALWLEADRMASFKVTEEIFKTERNVVAEEWRLRYANQPYGTMWQDSFRTVFKTHNYKWMPIGDMEQLAKAKTDELQAFHDRYYIPNNACLIVAGQFDVEQAKKWVSDYYGWIPKGAEIARETKPELEQTDARELIVYKTDIPLTRATLAWPTTAYNSDDQLKLDLLGEILGGGRSSRLYKALVGNDKPIAVAADAGNQTLQDAGTFNILLGMLPGNDYKAGVEIANAEVKKLIESGVTADELEKAKTQTRLSLVQGRQTAENIATALGEEEVFGGDVKRVNTAFDRLDKVTADDLKAVAVKYLKPEKSSLIVYVPGTDPKGASTTQMSTAQQTSEAIPTATPEARVINFPPTYPQSAPMNKDSLAAKFNKGQMQKVGPVTVIALKDDRLPVVNWQIVMRGGSDAEEALKTGLSGLTAQMLSRGAGELDAAAFSEDLESRGISLGARDGSDTTSIVGSSTLEQLDHGLQRTKDLLLSPKFEAGEFAKLQRQALSGLMQSLVNPSSVAGRDLTTAVYGDSPLGRVSSPKTLGAITLDDVKGAYNNTYKPDEALFVFSGAIDLDKAVALASPIIEAWAAGKPPQAEYDLPAIPGKRKIILVDNPEGKQATIRMGIQAYTIKNEDRFAGSIAGQALSAGIDSRLNRVLRAQKGLTYGASGTFSPSRHGGTFGVDIDTKPETAGEAISSAFEVLQTMRDGPISEEELSNAKQRTAGYLVLQTQTIGQQAGRRVDTILNGYPEDYYDNYAKRIAQVQATQVKDVMEKYVDPDRMTIVVVAPASAVKAQLEKLGDVQVVAMPRDRKETPATQPAK